MTEKAPLWTKNFILISLLNFSLVLTFYLLVIVIVDFAMAELGATTAQAGLISGVFIIGTLLGRLLIAKVMNQLGGRLTLALGLGGFFLFSLLYFLPLGLNSFFALRFLHGFMMGVASTVLGTTIAQIIPATRRGEGIGYYSMSNTLGTAIGPFVAIWMMLHTGYQSIFIVSSLIAFIAFLACFAVKFPKITTSKAQNITTQSQWIEQYLEPKAIPIAMIILISSICYAGVLAFINLYAKEIDLVAAATLYFLIYAVAVILSRPFTGPLMDRKGENIVIYPAFICMVLGLILLSQASTAWMLLLSAIFMGLGFGNVQSICQTIAVKRVELARMGYATSTFFIFLEMGLGFGPYLLGLCLDVVTYSHMYLFTAAVAVVAMVLYTVLHARHSKIKS